MTGDTEHKVPHFYTATCCTFGPPFTENMNSKLLEAQRFLIKALVFFEVLAIFPLTPDPASDVKILGYELFAFAALALWAFTGRHTKESVRRSSALFPLFAAFLVLNLAASFVSMNIGYSLIREFIKLTALFILFVVAADAFHTPKHVWGLAGAICAAVVLASLYGFVQAMGMDPFPWDASPGRLREAPATFGNPNFASHTLVLAVILACGLCTHRKGRWALLCIPPYLYHFTLTHTRGSLLGLAGAFILVLVALFVSRKVKKPVPAIALTLGIVLSVGMTGIAAIATVTKTNTGQPYPDDRSMTARYNSFYGACRMIQDRPWLGHGPGMYQVVEPEYWTLLEKERYRSISRRGGHVHNEPLEIAVEAGLPAAIVYIAILIFGLYYGLSLGLSSKDSARQHLGMTFAAFFAAFFIDGLFGFNVHVPVSAVLLFLIAGATAGVWRERDEPALRHSRRFGRFPLAWRFAALGCATIIPILGIRDFSAQFYQQRGDDRLHYEAHGDEALRYKANIAADESFRRAASLAPYDWLPPYYLGVTAMSMQSPDEGAKHFARTLQLNPNYVNAQFQMAQALFNAATLRHGEKAQAILKSAVTYAERAAQLNPRFPEVHDLLGRVSYLRAKHLTDSSHGKTPEAAKVAWQESEDHFLRAIEYGSKRKDVLYRLIVAARLERDDTLSAQVAPIPALEDK